MELGYIIQFYSVVKENGMTKFTGKWTKLETIVLGEISQAQKEISLTCSHVQALTSQGIETRMVELAT